MPRPKKAVVDYFPHFVDHGKTIFTLENRFGNDGYAFWFKTLEILGASEQHYIDCRDIETWEFLLAKTRVDEENAVNIVNLLAKLGAVDKDLWENKIIWSSNFVDNLTAVYKRREIEVFTKEDIESFCLQKPRSTPVNVGINPTDSELTPAEIPKVKESKVKESKEKKSNYAEAVQLTEMEYKKLVDEHGEENTKELIAILNNYKLTSGRKYKSDYHTMVGKGWVLKKFREDNAKKGVRRLESVSSTPSGNTVLSYADKIRRAREAASKNGGLL